MTSPLSDKRKNISRDVIAAIDEVGRARLLLRALDMAAEGMTSLGDKDVLQALTTEIDNRIEAGLGSLEGVHNLLRNESGKTA